MYKARSIRSFAAQLNLTNNPDRSSLVQLYLGSFMWMDLRVLLLRLQSRTKESTLFRFVHEDGSTSTSNSPSVKNQGIGRISDKRKISVS